MIYSSHASEGVELLKRIEPFYAKRYPNKPPLSQQVMDAVAEAPFGKEVLALSESGK